MPTVLCTTCQKPYPVVGMPHRCPDCGGVYDFDGSPVFEKEKVETSLPGIWRYRHTFGLFPNAPLITLGEGNTPLIWDDFRGGRVGIKLETLNPTGSYKDRGSAVLVSQLMARGVHEAVEDSSGNAGASFAGYAARAGLKARIFVPDYASGPKRLQIEMYGAELVRVPGPRSAAAEAVLKAVAQGGVYASHASLPFGLMGIATIAYELWESIGDSIGTVIAPVGQGGLLLGLIRGFSALHQKNLIKQPPYIIGVQAKNCAPLWTAFTKGKQALDSVVEGVTVAEGVRTLHPVHLSALLSELHPGNGEYLAVDEENILPARADLAHRGIYVEPTSAIVWNALNQVIGKVPEPIVLIMSGSGLKYIPS